MIFGHTFQAGAIYLDPQILVRRLRSCHFPPSAPHSGFCIHEADPSAPQTSPLSDRKGVRPVKEEQFFDAFSNIDPQFIEETRNPIPKKRSRKILGRVITGLITLLLLILAILPLKGKNYNPYYRVSEEGGKYFLVSRSEPEHYHAGNNCCEPWHGLYFDSLQEMRDDFINCNFDDNELYHIQSLLNYHPGKVAIPDIYNLCQPILPDNIHWSGGASWSGSESYSFRITQDTHPRFSFTVLDKEYYEQRKEALTNYTGSDLQEVIRVEQIADRNATVYYTKSKNGYESSFLFYVIEVGGRAIFVEEHSNIGNDPLCNYMHIYICEKGFYGAIYLEYDEERPSVEYLSSFGLEPYEIDK